MGFCVGRGLKSSFLYIFHILLTQTIISTQSFSKECQFIADSRTGVRGSFQSPGWPNSYPPNSLCHYKLQGSEWEGIKIVFHQFELEEKYTEGCLKDYVEVTTVSIRGQRTFQGRYCGSELPPPIYVLHPVAELEFRSNPSLEANGFLASYEFIDEKNVPPPRLNGTSPCGSIERGQGGIISSPGYPLGYVAGLDCLWLIRVEYSHAIYLRIRELDFQGSISNCQKAQLTIYDGYESSLEEATILKKFCGDSRHYSTEDEKVLLSGRNRLLVRFTTGEPSKPPSTPSESIGFSLIWSDVIFDSKENCTKLSRFPCKEARYCFTKNHEGGACPDLKHYCVFDKLRCDGIPHCGEMDASDEQNCYKAGIVASLIIAPLVFILLGLAGCFVCYRSRRNGTSLLPPQNSSFHKKKEPNCWILRWLFQPQNSRKGSIKVPNSVGPPRGKGARLSNNEEGSSPSFRTTSGKIQPSSGQEANQKEGLGPLSFKNELAASMTSDLDIVSPASGFSDTESDSSVLNTPYANHCTVHGPGMAVVPLRYLSRQFNLLPVVHEGSYSDNGTFDEEGSSTYSSHNSDSYCHGGDGGGKDPKSRPLPPLLEEELDSSSPPPDDPPHEASNAKSASFSDWRLRNLRGRFQQRADAVYGSDDAKSSANSSPRSVDTVVCPRCLEMEQQHQIQMAIQSQTPIHDLSFISLDKEGAILRRAREAAQFDSGIDLTNHFSATSGGGGGGGGTKNVSFDSSVTEPNNSDGDSLILLTAPSMGQCNAKCHWRFSKGGVREDLVHQGIQTDPLPELAHI